jgi:hypothetical protein
MTTSTFATVVVTAADQSAAQSDLPGMFTSGYTDNPDQPEVATYYVSSGAFYDSELDFIVNEATWSKTVKFGDAQVALDSLWLKAVVEAVVSPTVDAEVTA